MIKSPLRYPGGKSRAVEFLSSFVPDCENIVEPFFGGGSLSIYLAQKFPNKKIYANDLNFDLYCFWQSLKTDGKDLVEMITEMKNNFTDGRVLHQTLINRRFTSLAQMERARDFFILNRITFSGLVDCGGYSEGAFQQRFTDSSIKRLSDTIPVIQNIDFSSEDYGEFLGKFEKNSFMFLDPPYYSVRNSKLYGKKGDLHLKFDHNRLKKILTDNKNKFLLTYDNSGYIRDLYENFFIRDFLLSYGMNNYKQEIAKKGNELLISNYPLDNSHKISITIKPIELFG